jgi:hypothetical protein
MALSGTLVDFNLFSIFSIIKSQNKIGTLLVENENEYVKIFFDQGNVIGVDSDLHETDHSIVSILLRSNEISPEEMNNILQQQNHQLKSVEDITVESGVITLQDLQKTLYIQAMQTIYRVFLWTSGNFRFDPIISDDLSVKSLLPLSIETILMDAANYLDEWSQVQKRLPDQSQILVQTTVPENLLSNIGQNGTEPVSHTPSPEEELTHEDKIVLHYFEHPVTIENVLYSSKYHELDTCKHIAKLIENGLLRVSNQQPISATPVMRQISDILDKQSKSQLESSRLFLPFLVIFALVPLLLYIIAGKESDNFGIASFSRNHIIRVNNMQAVERSALICILNGSRVVDGKILIPSDTTPDPIINKEIRQLFSQYESDPTLGRPQVLPSDANNTQKKDILIQ